MKKYLFLTVLSALFGAANAQEELLQWTGVVRNDLLEPLPYVHVLVKRDFRGTAADKQGAFTIVVHPTDTLLVSCVGYKLRYLPIPLDRSADSKHFTKDVILEPDTILLKEVVIFPWKTFTEFKEAFMALEMPENDLERAYRNIAAIQGQVYDAIVHRPSSPNANFRDLMALRTNKMSNLGHFYPTYMITNPLAWANFFKAIREGDFKKKDTGKDPYEGKSAVDEYKKQPDNE